MVAPYHGDKDAVSLSQLVELVYSVSKALVVWVPLLEISQELNVFRAEQVDLLTQADDRLLHLLLLAVPSGGQFCIMSFSLLQSLFQFLRSFGLISGHVV